MYSMCAGVCSSLVPSLGGCMQEVRFGCLCCHWFVLIGCECSILFGGCVVGRCGCLVGV